MPDEPSETHSNTHLVHRLRWFHSNDGSSGVQSAHQYSISTSALLLPRLDVLWSSVWRLGKLQDSLSHRPQVTIITTAITFIQLQRWLVWHRVMVVVTSKNLTNEHFCTTGCRHPVCRQFHVTKPIPLPTGMLLHSSTDSQPIWITVSWGQEAQCNRQTKEDWTKTNHHTCISCVPVHNKMPFPAPDYCLSALYYNVSYLSMPLVSS